MDVVRARIREALRRVNARLLVCSAACGADQAALEAARELGVARRVILPFAESRFRQTSVVDRGEQFGAPFDRTMADLRAENAVVTLDAGDDEAKAYVTANLVILDRAQEQARETADDLVAILVAESPGAYDDAKESFAEEAKARGLRIVSISTQA
jgi:hypothetical protein